LSALEIAPKPKTIRGARNIAAAVVPRTAGSQHFNNAWPMSAELEDFAYKITRISLLRSQGREHAEEEHHYGRLEMKLLFSLSVIATAIMLAAAAKAQNYPWCALYRDGVLELWVHNSSAMRSHSQRKWRPAYEVSSQ
jgi:hypothetical protein